MKRAAQFILVALNVVACVIALSPSQAQIMQVEKDELPALGASKTLAAEITPCISWIDPNVEPKGYLVCVHGLGLHKGTYKQFGEAMSKLGWGVYAVDIRGFGSFQTMPGNRTVDFPGCLEDVRGALQFVHAQHPGKPVFIVGESMGGAIALQMTSLHPELVQGLISSVPAGERNHKLGDSVKVGLHLLGGAHKDMDVTNMVVNRSTQKSDLREEWLHDELGRFSLSPLELMQFQKFMNENHKAAAKITNTPVLMLQGHSDQLVKLEGQESLINEIPCKDSVLVWVDKAEHLILEEGQFDEGVITALTGWLDAHIAKSSAGSPG